jgi:hypothetical protein
LNSKLRQKWWISSKGGGIISTSKQICPPKHCKSALKLTRVEVVEMVEIFSVYRVRMHLKFWAMEAAKE